MNRMRFLRRFGLALGAFLALTAENLSIDQDELQCEQAVAYLASCCPGFDNAGINCTAGGCVRPDLDLPTSKCLQSLSCDQVVARGLCNLGQREAAAKQSGDGDGDDDDRVPDVDVCQ